MMQPKDIEHLEKLEITLEPTRDFTIIDEEFIATKRALRNAISSIKQSQEVSLENERLSQIVATFPEVELLYIKKITRFKERASVEKIKEVLVDALQMMKELDWQVLAQKISMYIKGS